MMYKNSKAVKANTMKDHLRLKKLGYGHTKPKKQWQLKKVVRRKEL